MTDGNGDKHVMHLDEAGNAVSDLFDDPFHSVSDGQAETRHVFLAANGLPERWALRPYFSIAELGFGTGLNFLETWRIWRETRPYSGQLSFTSFEAFPLSTDQMQNALARFPELAGLAERLFDALPSRWPPEGEERPVRVDRQTQLMVVIGDARKTVADWPGSADAWYLDGFSPAKNPEMWEPHLLDTVCRKTARGGTFATYTAAGDVRRALSAAGFTVEKQPGFGTKRDMLAGRKA